ncbi:Helix-loop-helix DNA-binding domain-containing protein [Carex littledalei]|uniref:Helix-loop-helix DNA-binding domain-containing protein n=1 Tax=Carex littledalei TaxID=544730 RepID=A0A833QLY9_9POAL|nr:Helix-loop-helix DNA-binding domain-containing protein [Carex littledalei]
MEQVSTSPKRKRGQNDAPITERLRREKAAMYYTVLQSLVPTLFPKATRSKVVDETIKYIRYLEGKLVFLKQQQMALPVQPILLTQQNNTSAVEVTVSGNVTFFGMSFASRPGVLSRVLRVFVNHLADVLMATIASDSGVTRITVTAHVLEAGARERIKTDLMAL